MNPLLVSTSSGSRGGGEIFLLYLAQALHDAGHSPALWCASHRRMDELAERFSLIGQVYRDEYPNSYLDRPTRVMGAVVDRSTARRMAKRFSDIPCDVVHLNKQTNEDGLDLLSAVRASGKPSITTVHITQTNRSLGAFGGGIRDAVARRVMRGASHIIRTAVSDARGEELKKQLGGTVKVIYNAVSPPPQDIDREVVRSGLLAEWGWSEDALVVVCLARLVPQKDPERFLRLAVQLRQREPKARFLWIGDGPEMERFHALAKDAGLEGDVAVTGWIGEPRGLLAAADLYLHPAAYEGLPLAILEAMAAGLPCVLSPEIVAEMKAFDETTVMIADESGRWLEKAIDPAARSAFSRQSLDLYDRYFRPEAMASSFLSVYQEALS